MPESYYPERRSGKDRRKKPTSPLSWGSLFGSRRYGRRKEDRLVPYYVDRYGMDVVLAFLFALTLSITDGFLTLKLVSEGATEINPIMDFFLRAGPVPFLLAKYILTAFGLTLLLVHKNFAFLRGQITGKVILGCSAFFYVLLIAYEISLILSQEGRN